MQGVAGRILEGEINWSLNTDHTIEVNVSSAGSKRITLTAAKKVVRSRNKYTILHEYLVVKFGYIYLADTEVR